MKNLMKNLMKYLLILCCVSVGGSVVISCDDDVSDDDNSGDDTTDENTRPNRPSDSDTTTNIGDDSTDDATQTNTDSTAISNDECTALTAEEYENNEGNNEEFTAKFFPTEDRNNEYIDMFFRSGDLGTHAYGEGDNADLYTCRQCLFIVRNGKRFYPVSGTITVLEGSDPMGTTLIAEMSELTLIEITISDSYHSISVEGGECVTLAPASIDTTKI